MYSSRIIMIIVFIFLLFLSGLYSMSEAAFMSVNKIRVKTLANEGNKSAKIVDHLLVDSDSLFSSILVMNNLVNVAASSLVTSFVISILGNEGIGVAIATGFVTLMILIFGEIIPKSLATKNAEKMTFLVCRIINITTFILIPVVKILNFISHFFIHLLRADVSNGPTMTEEDLKTIVSVSHEEGVLEDEEKEMINNAFEFDDKEVKEIMTPRIHVVSVSDSISYTELKDVLKDCHYSRIPVYSHSVDELIGIVYIKDIMMGKVNKIDFNIRDIVRPLYYVYEFNHISTVFDMMRKDRVSFAVVLDEYGVMSGVITIEDIIEEIVGNISDEYDIEENSIIDLGNNNFLIDGSLDIDEVNEKCYTQFKSEDFESIGGLVLGMIPGNPKLHQSIDLDNARLTIEKIEKNRIVQLKLTLIEDNIEKHD